MKRLLILILLASSPAWAETLYLVHNGAGSKVGTSLANAFGETEFNTSGNWGVGAGKITAGDNVVCDGAGITRLTIQASGTNSATRITLVGQNGATLVSGINGNSKDYIAVLNFSGSQASASDNWFWIQMDGCDGWLIEGNTVGPTYGGFVGNSGTTVNTYNIIRRNTLSDICGVGDGASGRPMIELYGDHNLVEYNVTTGGLDRVRFYGAINVARNNRWGATDTADYPSTSQYPHHIDAIQGFEASTTVSQILYERNYDVDNVDSIKSAGSPNAHGLIFQNGDASSMSWLISRFNLFIRPGGQNYIFQDYDRINVYNSTHIKTNDGYATAVNSGAVYQTPASDVNDWRNNTWTHCPKLETGGEVINVSDGFSTTFTSAANHVYDSTTAALPSGASPSNLSSADPLFTDGLGTAGHDDYTLTSSSPLRATGAPIATVSGAVSNSTSITLASGSGYRIFDGWGITGDTDKVKIGSGSYTQVVSINPATGALVVADAQTCADGASVYVQGTEDVGALPYGSAAASGTISNVGTAYTVAASGSVRMVEFIEDGATISIDYASPYQYTSSGGTVVAYVYSLYANNAPVAAATPGSNSVTVTGRTKAATFRFN